MDMEVELELCCYLFLVVLCGLHTKICSQEEILERTGIIALIASESSTGSMRVCVQASLSSTFMRSELLSMCLCFVVLSYLVVLSSVDVSLLNQTCSYTFNTWI